MRGDPEHLASPGLAIVGARVATAYGRSVSRALAGDLAIGGLTVISGLARGIDGEAHRGALTAGATIAVLGHGPDRIYPAAHRVLAEAIVDRGALVSEFPPGVTPRPHFFPLRNRVISGLSQGVVVIEAKRRSGSLVTARHALEQGREVMAVPGPIDVETSGGPNALLRDGAHVILESADVFRALGRERATRPSERVDPLLELLAKSPLYNDEIAARLGESVESVSRRVARLEIEGCVLRGVDGRVTRVSLS